MCVWGGGEGAWGENIPVTYLSSMSRRQINAAEYLPNQVFIKYCAFRDDQSQDCLHAKRYALIK